MAGEGRQRSLETQRDHSKGALSRRALKRVGVPLAIALACASVAAGFASAASERTLSFYGLNTGETATVVYMRDGRYLPRGLADINHILRDWRRDEATQMDPRLVDLIWEIYQQTGSTQPITVISGYRSPQTNEMLRSRSSGVAQNSQHVHGKAIDLQFPDVDLATLRNVALRLQIGGVGFYPTSGAPFVHIDTGSVRHWPRLSREQLAQVFPDGHTLHIPSDGTPLPGYAEAQTAYQQRGDQVVALFTDDIDADRNIRLAGLINRSEPLPVDQSAPAFALADPTVLHQAPAARAEVAGMPAEAPVVAALAFAPAAAGELDPLDILADPPAAVNSVALSVEVTGYTESPIQRRWFDPLAVAVAPSVADSPLPLLSADTTTRQEAFAVLTAPDVSGSPQFLAKPDRIMAVGFADQRTAMRSARFDDSNEPSVGVIDLLRLSTVAQAR